MNMDFERETKQKGTKYHYSQARVAGVVLVIFIVVGYLGVQHIFDLLNNYNKALRVIENKFTLLEVRVEELVKASEKSTQQSINEKVTEITKELTDAQNKTSQLEQKLKTETGLSAQKITEIEDSLSKNYDLVSIIKDWRVRTPLVRCKFDNGFSNGSGVLVLFNEDGISKYSVLTNRHILVSGNFVARDCTLEFPSGAWTYVAVSENGDIEATVDNFDLGRINIVEADSYIKNSATNMNRFCSLTPSIGDEVISIGYPSIGSVGDITATDGIISGFESSYFITSAKIEKGNSGGIVVLLKDNCLLGVSTFVQLGTLESLARILNINVARNKFDPLSN